MMGTWMPKTCREEKYYLLSELQIPVPHRYSNFLLMMGTWMPETCREEKYYLLSA